MKDSPSHGHADGSFAIHAAHITQRNKKSVGTALAWAILHLPAAPPVRETLMSVHRNAKLDDPREFAGYDLMHCLGRGGQAEVWSVVRRGLYDITRPLAVKVMLPELSDNEQYCDIFISEGRIAMQLSSANIVPVFELGRHDGLLFMVMQRIDGVNLAEFQRRTRNVYNTLPLDVVLHITGEILAALFVAHEQTVAGQPAGIIHRDVKPANIIVSSSGDVRLTDFGIARAVSPDSSRAIPIGTLRYISREQAEGRVDRTSDLFCVGAILHEMLSGRLFREVAQNEEQLYAAIFSYNEIPQVGRVIPEDIERLRRGLLHPDPKRRFQSAAEAMEALSECNGYRYARLKLARIYETAIGIRSSGFTDSHTEARPSFLLNRKSQAKAAARRSYVFNRSGVGRETAFQVDEDATTSLHMPLPPRVPAEDVLDEGCVDEPTSMYIPVVARGRWHEAGPHPVAPGEEAGETAQAITPTLRLLLPVGHMRETRDVTDTPDRTDATPPPRVTLPLVNGSVVREAEPVSNVDRAARPDVDRSDPRNVVSTSGTIETPARGPDASPEPTPIASKKSGQATSQPSLLYFILLIALLCALVGVSTAWFLESRSNTGAEAKP